MSDALRTADLPTLLGHRAWVRALAGRLLADENAVDDVEQDTWTAALRAGPDEPRAMRSWLGSVASRFALQRLRGDSRRARRELAVAGPDRGGRSAAEVVADADTHGHVVQAVLALDEPYRATILLRYFEGLKVAEVAARMDVPVETVRTRLRRAHERLREKLEREHGRPLAALLAPVGAAPFRAPAVPAAPASLGFGASLGGGLAVAGAIVAVIALGAWGLSLAQGGGGGGGPQVAGALDDGEGAAGGKGGGAGGGKGGAAAAPRAGTREERPRAGKPEAAAAETTGPRPWIAYDLADGKPIPRLPLTIRTPDGESRVETDGDGSVLVDRSRVLAVVPADAAWTFAAPTEVKFADERSLWFWREAPVTGTVRSADAAKPLDVGAVKLTWTIPHDLGAPADTPGRSAAWMAAHGFRFNSKPADHVAVDAQGTLSGSMPAIGGIMLTAEAGGFAASALPLTPERDFKFALATSVHITGRVLDSEGNPVPDLDVALDNSFEVRSREEFARLMSTLSRTGGTFGGQPDKGTFNMIGQARTNVRGVFRMEALPHGHGVVSVQRPGFVTARADLGTLSADVPALELRLVPSTARVVFLNDGAPLRNGSLIMNVADGRENGFQLATDAEGRADPGHLQAGRWYRTGVEPRENGKSSVCFRWDGQESIDLDACPKNPQEDK